MVGFIIMSYVRITTLFNLIYALWINLIIITADDTKLESIYTVFTLKDGICGSKKDFSEEKTNRMIKCMKEGSAGNYRMLENIDCYVMNKRQHELYQRICVLEKHEWINEVAKCPDCLEFHDLIS